MKKLLLLCSAATIVAPATAFAQSTGSQEFEEKTIIVTGTRTQQVGGIQTPDAPKAKVAVGQEMISRSSPGQAVLDTINIVPGVSFQNNEAYGVGGGTITMRGFDSTRISYTLDGSQLNDSGSYNIFANYSIDPELIEQVNVNLGSTDVDSPTASATGGTINQRTRNPGREFGGRLLATLGQFDYRRIFALVDTGEITSFGTRAFVAASKADYANPFNHYGKLNRTQLNAKVYQPVGSSGDFVTVAARYNRDRNNQFGSAPLRNDLTRVIGTGAAARTVPRIVGASSTVNRFPQNRNERSYFINYPCTMDVAQAGAVDSPAASTGPSGTPDPNGDYASCGTEFDRRYNPSNSLNIRANSRFTLAEGLVLTLDPSYQYTKVNNGGTVTAREYGYDINPAGTTSRANCSTTTNNAQVTCIAGYFGGSPYGGGVDLNGDGDILDTVTVLAPSQSRTRRYALIAGLRYEITPTQSVRLTFTHDYSNHRQTGEVGLLDANGEPVILFPMDNPVKSPAGAPLQKRDRQSFAILDKVGAEYRGEFGPLTVNIGASLPRFTRDLQQNCFTSSAGGFVECGGTDGALNATIASNNPYTFNATTAAVTGFAPPAHRVLHWTKLLPNLGAIYDLTSNLSAFASYSKNISIAGTENLYNAFYFPADRPEAKPAPETTDTVDGGLRYRSSRIQAQVQGWYTKFDNRLASAYDPDLNQTIFRNLGRVEKWGIDGSLAFKPVPAVTAYVFGSYLKSRIRDNLQTGTLPAGVTCDTVNLTSNDARSCSFTAGKRESGSPVYSYGTSTTVTLGPLDLGVTAKKTGRRYVFDSNLPTFAGTIGSTTSPVFQIYPAATPSYWLVNLDARLNLRQFGMGKTYLQLNVYNLFDKFYVGGFGGGPGQTISAAGVYSGAGFTQIGAPRTISGSINLEF